MRFINTADLKNRTNKILKGIHRNGAVVVTYRGKPYAAIEPLSEEGIEDFIFEHSPVLKNFVAEAWADVRAGRLVHWEGFLEHERRAGKATRRTSR